jgi:hypothetical protein
MAPALATQAATLSSSHQVGMIAEIVLTCAP